VVASDKGLTSMCLWIAFRHWSNITEKELLQKAFIMSKMDEGITNHGEFSFTKVLQQDYWYSMCPQVKTKQKAEIQAISSSGFQYITEVYLQRKLKEGDWIWSGCRTVGDGDDGMISIRVFLT
jgi:hypothetical protein